MSGHLKCFGVGDGAACANRNHSSYLYTLGSTAVLVDCGEPVSRSFKATGLSYDTIDHLFLSHLHSDHVGGLFMLLQGFWLEQRRKDLVIHLPADAIAPLRQMLPATYLFEELLTFRLVFQPWQAGQPVPCGAWKATPFRTTHLDGFRRRFQQKYPGNYDAFCFLLEGDGQRIGHTADLGAIEDMRPLLAQPLDLLVCELAHIDPQKLFASLQGQPIRHLVFTHLERSRWERIDDMKSLARKLLAEANVTFVNDQDVVAF